MGAATSRYTVGLATNRNVLYTPGRATATNVHIVVQDKCTYGRKSHGHGRKHRESRLAKTRMQSELADEQWLELSMEGHPVQPTNHLMPPLGVRDCRTGVRDCRTFCRQSPRGRQGTIHSLGGERGGRFLRKWTPCSGL